MGECNDSGMETCCPPTGLRPWHDDRQTTTSTGLTMRLAPDRAYPIGNALHVRCVTGNVWISQEGNPNDIVLAPGEQFVPARAGKVVIQALSNDAAVRLASAR